MIEDTGSMTLVFFSVVLNHHQAPIADEFYKLLGNKYCFVESVNLGDTKGGDDFSCRSYLLRAWESEDSYRKAMELARTAECCVFSGVQALPFQRERMKSGLLSFDMSERWLKQGLKNVFSPAISKMFLAYLSGGWKNKPLYKLCCSSFAAGDHHRLEMYRDKCYKWGYFTHVEMGERKIGVEESAEISIPDIVPLMWCSRYLVLKHPELPVLLAERLKRSGYSFHLDMYGDGEYREKTEHLIENLGLGDCITIHGNIPNNFVRKAMKESDIFLFTSDRYEGWGAVANESLSCGCVLVASDAIGSSRFLIKEGENGFMFHSSKTNTSFGNPDMHALDSLYERVAWLLNHPAERKQMQQNSVKCMQEIWSPRNAVKSLLTLIENLKQGKDTPIMEGPCSKA